MDSGDHPLELANVEWVRAMSVKASIGKKEYFESKEFLSINIQSFFMINDPESTSIIKFVNQKVLVNANGTNDCGTHTVYLYAIDKNG